MMLEAVFFLVAVTLASSAAVNEPTSTCGYAQEPSNSSAMCSGKCSIRNAVCDMIHDTDQLYCGCIFCNFQPALGICAGQCSNSQLDKCIKRVAVPKSDSDCGCASCKGERGRDGKMVCSGDCFKSGLTCKVKKVEAYNLEGYAMNCVCSE